MLEYTKKEKTIIEEEGKKLQKTFPYQFEEDKKIGLALSGGGIRSASFSLGALQALVDGQKLDWFHYLSTVSGGGFIGSSLTWFLSQDKTGFGLSIEDFPLGAKNSATLQPNKEINSQRVAILSHIRQHCDYLFYGDKLNIFSILSTIIRTMALSLIIYFLCIALPIVYSFRLVSENLPSGNSSFLCFSLFALFLFLIFAMIYAPLSLIVRSSDHSKIYSRQKNNEKYSEILLIISTSLFALGILPFLNKIEEILSIQLFGVAGVSLAVGIGVGFVRMIMQLRSIKLSQGITGRISVNVACVLLAFGVFAIARETYDLIFAPTLLEDFKWFPQQYTDIFAKICFLVLVVSGFLLGWFVNVNLTGFHRLYRDRLMEAFMPNLRNAAMNITAPADDADTAKLADMCETGPYHIINANVVLTSSENTRRRRRGGENFILSPLYSGCDATGWRPTADWKVPTTKSSMTLPTATAISGAAINPRTAPDGRGMTRTALISFLMTLTNARLGFWAVNPAAGTFLDDRLVFRPKRHPNFLVPGIWQGLLGRDYAEHASFVELTDGGHFDNTGLYELIRRKLKLIVLVDGSADKDFNYSSLATALQRIRVDFGAVVRFEQASLDLRHLLPGTGDETPLREKYHLAKQGFALGRIDYEPTQRETWGKGVEDGTLILIKSTIIEDLPADVLSYKSANRDFPDESTADQFFDEVQFEAYRELGYQITKDALGDPQVQNEFHQIRPRPKAA